MKLDISIAYIVVSLIAIIVLIYLLYECSKKSGKEKFCSCRRVAQSVCPDTFNQTALYETGKLTENSPLAQIQKQGGEKKWPSVMPADIFETQLRQNM